MSTVMNDKLDILPHVVEAILNHVSSQASGKSGVGGVYNKALYLRERVDALNRSAAYVDAIGNVKTIDNVVSLREAVGHE
jgi:hypothetical protein